MGVNRIFGDFVLMCSYLLVPGTGVRKVTTHYVYLSRVSHYVERRDSNSLRPRKMKSFLALTVLLKREKYSN